MTKFSESHGVLKVLMGRGSERWLRTSVLCRHQAHMWCIHTCRQSTYAHKIINKAIILGKILMVGSDFLNLSHP